MITMNCHKNTVNENNVIFCQLSFLQSYVPGTSDTNGLYRSYHERSITKKYMCIDNSRGVVSFAM